VWPLDWPRSFQAHINVVDIGEGQRAHKGLVHVLPRVDCTFIMSLEETSSDSDSSNVMDAAASERARVEISPRMVLASGHGMG